MMVKKIAGSVPAVSKRVITTSSTAEYFSKNLQQVGFSSATKAILTTLKEAVDNSLDACEDHRILPDISVEIEKLGAGSTKNTDKVRIKVVDNGPGIELEDIPKVYGEYLASSKFGRGRCSRGQQGIGISAVTTWALQTTATGVNVITKTKKQKQALSCVVSIDLKNNKGIIKEKKNIEWDRTSGTSVEFFIDGRIQLNGEAGILNYIKGTVLLNPHLTLTYKVPEMQTSETFERVTNESPDIPEAIEPHPHTMKLGEFISHAKLFGQTRVEHWLKKGFSRLGDSSIEEVLKKSGLEKKVLTQTLRTVDDTSFKTLFTAIQDTDLKAPSTKSVLSVGEVALSKSITRLGEIDFFSVLTRKPAICDFKPVQVEVAIARLKEKISTDTDESVQVLRFANRVPLQFDKSGCAIVKAINSVNWRAYGLKQSRSSLPVGPYIIAVSVVSPFIKFKNASKETIDASDELVEEIRRALMQTGQKLSRHINKESKEKELEQRLQHIEKFGPILVETLIRITGADKARKERAELGLVKILGRDAKSAEQSLNEADKALAKHIEATKKQQLQQMELELL